MGRRAERGGGDNLAQGYTSVDRVMKYDNLSRCVFAMFVNLFVCGLLNLSLPQYTQGALEMSYP